jgi:hypothetical protein
MNYNYNYNNNIIYTTMSAGTDASILGYSNEPLFSGANSKYVNTNNNNNPLFFGSNEVPGLPGLSGAKNNVDAAQGKVPGVCLMKGGKKRKSGKNKKGNKGRSIKLKTRIKIISGKYKMKNRKSIAQLKNTLRKKYSLKNKKNKSKNSRVKKGTRKNSTKKMNKKSNRNSRRHRRKYKGGSGGIPFSGLPYPAGYAQYSNNNPNTPSYSLGGVLKASESALANPVPLTPTNTCVDNYDHYVKKGFASRGH